MDKNGNRPAEGELGLLLYAEEPVTAMPSTVCDDRFTQNSAVAICRLMGYVISSNHDPIAFLFQLFSVFLSKSARRIDEGGNWECQVTRLYIIS